MSEDNRKSPIDILCEIFECEPEDLEFTIESDPSLNKIVEAMENYSRQNCNVLIDHLI